MTELQYPVKFCHIIKKFQKKQGKEIILLVFVTSDSIEIKKGLLLTPESLFKKYIENNDFNNLISLILKCPFFQTFETLKIFFEKYELSSIKIDFPNEFINLVQNVQKFKFILFFFCFFRLKKALRRTMM